MIVVKGDIMLELIKERKLKNLCPICLKPMTNGDTMKNITIVQRFEKENVAIEICEHHYVDPAILEKSKNKYANVKDN